MLVSRTRPAAEAVHVAERMGAELVAMGSAGAKAMAVVRGEADIYLHTGGQSDWDNCAPAAVAAAAGLHVSRADGSPIRYYNANPYLPDLLICRRELADEGLRDRKRVVCGKGVSVRVELGVTRSIKKKNNTIIRPITLD